MQPLNEISTHALAYLGDCVFECVVREYLVSKGLGTSAALNREALDFVRASAQAEAMKRILPILTEEEESVFKRGRNFFRTYIAVCRNKERSVRLTFHHNKITVTIDRAVTTINKKGITKEAALADIADVINAMDREKTA